MIKYALFLLFFSVTVSGQNIKVNPPEKNNIENKECPCHTKPSPPNLPKPVGEKDNNENRPMKGNEKEPKDHSEPSQNNVYLNGKNFKNESKCVHTCGKPTPPKY